jgi:hypothetical protein
MVIAWAFMLLAVNARHYDEAALMAAIGGAFWFRTISGT